MGEIPFFKELFMKINYKLLTICIIIPLAVGSLSGYISASAMDSFRMLNKPPLSPPAWLFPVVWTLLYILMGIASYIIWQSKGRGRDFALRVYALQLFFNLFWSYIFFGMQNYLFAFIWLLILWVLVIVTTVLFYRIEKTAGYLLIPYVLWVTFAAYLNFAIYLMN